MIQVVCWKWGRTPHFKKGIVYTAGHVNRLRNMVARNLSLDHQFCCITDDPIGIDEAIQVIPLWPDLADLGRCYVRLKAFAAEMATVIGPRFVSIDLDCVITGDIAPLIERREDFIIWGDVASNTPYNGSLWMMDAGARRQVWDDFDPATSPAEGRRRRHIGSDQAWIAARLGPGEARWTRQDGVLSFRRHVLSRRRRWRPEERMELPEGARIVFFHGRHDPSHREVRRLCPWVGEHWR